MNIKNVYAWYLETARGKLEEMRNKEAYKNDFAEEMVEKVNDTMSYVLNRTKTYLDMLVEQYKSVGKGVLRVKASTKTRLIVDISSPFGWLIDEVGLAWDPIMDAPYIPSTEIKGAISAKLTWDNKKARDVLLGSTDEKAHKSLIDFTDAYPVSVEGESLIERDVITPTYGTDKIKEHEASPTPIQFIVVSPGVVFEFLTTFDLPRLKNLCEIARKSENKKESELRSIDKVALEIIRNLQDFTKTSHEISDKKFFDQLVNNLKEKMEKIIEEVLTLWGVGAKTASDYSIFNINQISDVK